MRKSIAFVEALESRQLLSVAPAAAPAVGAISGVVFDDHNASGTQDKGDQGLANIKVFIDLHHTGAYVSGDPSTLTNSSGAYAFKNLAPGAYTFDAIPPTGFQQSYPFGGQEYSVTLKAGANLTGYNFGQTTGSHVAGMVYSNATGKPVGLGGVTLTIAAANGKGPSFTRTTDSIGYYGIGGLPNMAYKVTVQLPPGYMLASGSLSQTTPTLKSGQNDNAVNFTLTPAIVFGSSSRYVATSFAEGPAPRQDATGTSVFNGSVQTQNDDNNVYVNGAGPYYEWLGGGAEQHSSLTSSEIIDSGPVNPKDAAVWAVDEDNLPNGGSTILASAESYFQTTFTVKTAETYSLAVLTVPGTGAIITSSFTFTGPGGVAVVPAQNPSNGNEIRVNQTGTLQPGTYTVTLDITCGDNDDNGPTMSSYNLDLKFSV